MSMIPLLRVMPQWKMALLHQEKTLIYKVNHILVEHPLILYTNQYSITETSIPPIGPFKPLAITLQCLTPNCHGTALCSILLSVWAISIFIVVASILRKGIERREARFTRTWQANDGNQSPTLYETPTQAARHSTFMCGTGNCGRTKTHRDHLSQTIFGLRVPFHLHLPHFLNGRNGIPNDQLWVFIIEGWSYYPWTHGIPYASSCETVNGCMALRYEESFSGMSCKPKLNFQLYRSHMKSP